MPGSGARAKILVTSASFSMDLSLGIVNSFYFALGIYLPYKIRKEDRKWLKKPAIYVHKFR